MALARLETPPPLGGAVSSALGLTRERGERDLLALRRAGVLSAEQVRAVQHGFLLEAMTEAVAELGYANTSANEVVRRARVSRQTFYDLFTTREDCFLAALHTGHDHILDAARIGYRETQGPWDTKVRGALTEILALLEAQPALAELCITQSLAGPPAALRAHRSLVARFASALHDSARRAGERPVPDRVVRIVIDGVWMTVHEGLTDDTAGQELVGEIMFALCVPFQGAAGAARQLRLPSRAPVRDWSAPNVPPDEQARRHAEVTGDGTRKRILRYLLAHPGAASFAVSEATGATQSTTSRRLAALAKDRLIVSQKRAGRHSWHLTERGRSTLDPAPPPDVPAAPPVLLGLAS